MFSFGISNLVDCDKQASEVRAKEIGNSSSRGETGSSIYRAYDDRKMRRSGYGWLTKYEAGIDEMMSAFGHSFIEPQISNRMKQDGLFRSQLKT
jgi:hypothetical protein